MSTFSTACKTTHASPSSREQSCDSAGVILSQSGCDRGQVLATELNLMEMTDVEYTHLQHIIQGHMEAQASDPDHPTVFGLCSLNTVTVAAKDDAGSVVISPSPTFQAIDLSTSTEQQFLVSSLSGEKTPVRCGEVPASVLARVRREGGVIQAEPPAKRRTSLLTQPPPPARVCLEQRFNCMPGDIPLQRDACFFSMPQQSTEAQEAVKNPQRQKWIRLDTLKPITGMCGQVSQHARSIAKNFSVNYRPAKEGYIRRTNLREELQLGKENDAVAKPAVAIKYVPGPRKLNAAPGSEAAKARSNSRKRAPLKEVNQSRERHNSNERDRRRKIRVCCDELNTLVPFCVPETDKATTLQWTTAFLTYMKEMYGDMFKEEFQNAYCAKTALCLKPISTSSQVPVDQETTETPSTSLAAAQ